MTSACSDCRPILKTNAVDTRGVTSDTAVTPVTVPVNVCWTILAEIQRCAISSVDHISGLWSANRVPSIAGLRNGQYTVMQWKIIILMTSQKMRCRTSASSCMIHRFGSQEHYPRRSGQVPEVLLAFLRSARDKCKPVGHCDKCTRGAGCLRWPGNANAVAAYNNCHSAKGDTGRHAFEIKRSFRFDYSSLSLREKLLVSTCGVGPSPCVT